MTVNLTSAGSTLANYGGQSTGVIAGADLQALVSAVNGLAGSNVYTVSASGVLGNTSGTYIITDAGVAVLTLAAPSANGASLKVTSTTAYAHTITATGLLNTGTASVNTITFSAHAGASVELYGYNGLWQVTSYNNVTFS
jgi:hypothetical protein